MVLSQEKALRPSLRQRSLPSATRRPAAVENRFQIVQVSDGDRFPLPLVQSHPASDPAAVRVQVSDGDRFPLPHVGKAMKAAGYQGSKSPTEIASLCHYNVAKVIFPGMFCPSLRRRSLPSATIGVIAGVRDTHTCPSLRRRSLPSATHLTAPGSGPKELIVQVSDGDRFPLPPPTCPPPSPQTTTGPSLRRRSLPSATRSTIAENGCSSLVQVSDGDRFPLPPGKAWHRGNNQFRVQVSDGDRFPLPLSAVDVVTETKIVSKSPTEIASLCH